MRNIRHEVLRFSYRVVNVLLKFVLRSITRWFSTFYATLSLRICTRTRAYKIFFTYPNANCYLE